MTIDFSKMNEGDKVKFLCGGEATIEKISGKGKYHGDYKIKFLGYIGKWIYAPSGRADPEILSLWDVIEIIPKPFDWNEAKYKDAFIRNGGENPIYYLCSNPDNEDKVYVGYFSKNYDCLYNSFDVLKSEITRAPEQDLPLP